MQFMFRLGSMDMQPRSTVGYLSSLKVMHKTLILCYVSDLIDLKGLSAELFMLNALILILSYVHFFGRLNSINPIVKFYT